MGTINFTIKGLAACYRKMEDEFWNIVFPTDKVHRVYFETSKPGKLNRISLNDKTVTITTTASVKPDDYEDASFKQYVMDLTGSYLHEQGLFQNQNRPTEIGERRIMIPHAKLSSIKQREGRLNYVFPIDQPDKIQLIKDGNEPRIFSMLVGGNINVEQEGKVTIAIEGEEQIDLSDGDWFHFDNDCQSESERNDFQLYQDIFVNQQSADIRYEVISIMKPNFTKKISTDPPPLICDTVVISNTEGLE